MKQYTKKELQDFIKKAEKDFNIFSDEMIKKYDDFLKILDNKKEYHCVQAFDEKIKIMTEIDNHVTANYYVDNTIMITPTQPIYTVENHIHAAVLGFAIDTHNSLESSFQDFLEKNSPD